ncbi:MAG TPA: acyl carrier protein [Gemmatimonadaceae bacterium]|jgi:acyl carrier protein
MTDHTAEAVIEYLEQSRGIPRASLTNDAPLFTSGLLDSIDILNLIMFLETKFGVVVSPLEVSLEHFDTIASITALVRERGRRDGA